MYHQYTRRIRGMTMMEVLVAIAIIGILASIATVNYASIRTRARIGTAFSTLEGARSTAVVCVSRSSNLIAPASTDLVCNQTDIRWPALPSGWVYSYPDNPPTDPGCPTFDGDVSDRDFLYCAKGDGTIVTCTKSSCQQS